MSVHRVGGACFRGGACSRGVPGADPPTATGAGGKHPTGMHSCLKCNISNTFSKTYWSFAEDLCQAKHDAGVENFVLKNPLGGGVKLRAVLA